MMKAKATNEDKMTIQQMIRAGQRENPRVGYFFGDTREYLERKLGRQLSANELAIRDDTMHRLANGLPVFGDETNQAMNRPLEFITILNVKTKRTSSMSIGGRQDDPIALTIVGNLEHSDRIVPKTTEDADRLIKWLQEWKASQKPKE